MTHHDGYRFRQSEPNPRHTTAQYTALVVVMLIVLGMLAWFGLP